MNTIKQQWDLFSGSTVARDAPTLQRNEMRLAFYAGAEAILRVMWAVGEQDVTEEAGANILQGLREECQAFARDYGTKKGLPKAIVDAIAPGQKKGPTS